MVGIGFASRLMGMLGGREKGTGGRGSGSGFIPFGHITSELVRGKRNAKHSS